MMIICDIWGGERSQEFLARYVRQDDEALDLAKFELEAGYLVTLRRDEEFTQVLEFDHRATNKPN
ncbi:MAG: hypothetical protein CML31_05455 [Rhizobiales bacterium]|nr:hypothetical protein [Hoeflea sp.]MBG19400.1 hypothetical protein [Hyphomicrobiales bacterium]|tara:strand:- start:6244 stop:6438 length:195 start_codon:yes stop_codon:yes gene_type:complete